MSLAFKNPPVNEVVVAAYFNPPLSAFRSHHVGLFWERIKSEFPNVVQQPPVGFSMDIGPDVMSDELFPMPRYWFVAKDEVYLIQVEKNAFIFNWRRRGSNMYPRFHTDIKPAFDKYYNIFDEFIRTETGMPKLSIGLCELTYVNNIERCEFWNGPKDTDKVIPSFSTISPGLDPAEPLGFSCQYGYSVAADMNLSIGIRSRMAPQKSNGPTLVFEIKTGGQLGQVTKSVSDKWFERAHDTIISCFAKITSPDIQRSYWKPLEEML